MTEARCSVYVLSDATPRRDLEAALRGALIAMRDDLDYLSISIEPHDSWPPDIDAAIGQLDLPDRWRRFLRHRSRGLSDDLDPQDPVEFELGLLLAPFADHVISISGPGSGQFASYEAGTEARLALTLAQHEATAVYMTAHGCDPAHLIPRNADQ